MDITSGGLGFGSLKSKASGTLKKGKDKAATAALMGSLSSFNPFGKKKGKSAMPSLGSLSALTGATDTKGAVPGKKGSIVTLATKILIFVIATLFISLFAAFTLKKTKDFTTDNIVKMVLVLLIFNIALFGAFMSKISLLDFLISTQINILCFYMILTYTTLTTLFSNGIFEALKSCFSFIKTVTTDPTSIYDNGAKLFIPMFFFIIPTIVLLYNFTQSIMQFIIVLAITLATGAVILFPKFY
jgi:hypothetical protein